MTPIATRRSTPLCILATAGLLALACGGGGGEGTDEAAAREETPAEQALEEGGSIDGCTLVTQAEASELFGQTAERQEGTAFGGTVIAECLWTWDTESSNQLLQVYVWPEAAYGPTQGSEPFDLGERGHIRKHEVAGVDIAWVQDGMMVSLAYSTIGPDAPEAIDRAAAVEALARQAAERL
jgi:hypothetical protein